MKHLWTLTAVVLALGCGDDGDTLVCGEGTVAQAGACVPGEVLRCGEGTVADDGACLPEAPPVACGEGTVERDGVCELAAESTACGPGTHAEGGSCVADVACGEGTVAEEGWCVAAPSFACGPGTVAEGDLCVPEGPAEPAACGEGTVRRGARCVALDLQFVQLPFPEGAEVAIGQGSHGSASHSAEAAFAVDFPLPEGTPVAAARGGTVLFARGDSDTGCGDASCNDDANAIVIDHGDGTRGVYAHLEFEGALVAPGDVVCAGQVIGRSGNTGFSTGPHLHLHVMDQRNQSLPLRIAEYGASDGRPVSGLRVVSQNAAPEVCEGEPTYADCTPDVFAENGVVFDQAPPCSVASLDTPYPASGRVLTGTGNLFVAAFDAGQGRWLHRCQPTAPDGSFETMISWQAGQFGGDFSHLMLSAAPAGECRPLYGWVFAPKVYLR